MEDRIIVCGPTCGHRHDSLNGPTGCCSEHGPYMYFCNDCHERWERDNPRTAADNIEKAAQG